MTSAAIIVGIDAYASQPLTSAVNDARAFAAALTDLGLVAPEDVTLLTAPGDGEAPTRRSILNALYPFYTGERAVDRLYFFYAGHGLLACADAARALPQTALIPVDLEDLSRDGDLLIDLDSVIARLRLAGPAEQLFFIDACRDLAYEKHPDMTTAIGWEAAQAGAERAQAVLFAVPPLGQAVGARNGLGVMTRHLIDALHGKGIALDYSDELREYVVSPQSVAAYVEKRVLETVGTVPLWQRSYVLPSLDRSARNVGPIRVVREPGPVQVTVQIEPAAAAAATRVKLIQMEVEVCAWPPNAYGSPCPVKPRRYWLEAHSTAGTPEPPQLRIDTREEQLATFVIQPRGEAKPSAAAAPGSYGPAPGSVGRSAVAVVQESAPAPAPEPEPEPPKLGRVRVSVLEPQSAIDLERLDPPYTRWASTDELDEAVPAGTYRVRCRLGAEVYSDTEIDVEAGREVTVRPTCGSSPLLRELLGRPAPTAVISEELGPIQADVLGTALPIIGIKPFDRFHDLSTTFEGAVPAADPAAYGMRPLSLVIAVDGEGWPDEPAGVLHSIRASIEEHGEPEQPLVIQPLDRSVAGGRIGLALGRPPHRSFVLRIRSPHLGSLAIASASLERRATVATLTVRPDGTFDLSQNMLRLPGFEYDELQRHIPLERMVRELQLGQKLYASGELVAHRDNFDVLRELFYAKWTDPILSCMAYFAWHDAVRASGDDAAQHDRWLLGAVAKNLLRYFGDLPDARIVHGLQVEEARDELFAGLLERNEVPVLARSAIELAHHDSEGASLVTSLARRAVPGQAWLMTWELEEAT